MEGMDEEQSDFGALAYLFNSRKLQFLFVNRKLHDKKTDGKSSKATLFFTPIKIKRIFDESQKNASNPFLSKCLWRALRAIEFISINLVSYFVYSSF